MRFKREIRQLQRCDDLGRPLSASCSYPTLFKWFQTWRNRPQIRKHLSDPSGQKSLKRLAVNECLCAAGNEWASELIRRFSHTNTRWFVYSVPASRSTIYRLDLQQHAREVNNGGGWRMWLIQHWFSMLKCKASKHTRCVCFKLSLFILAIFLP